MAIFKVIDCRGSRGDEILEFDVQLIIGEIRIGDVFRCYETHHPADYCVLRVRSAPAVTTLSCRGFFFYKQQFVGAVIDTDKTGRPAGFHYEHKSQSA